MQRKPLAIAAALAMAISMQSVAAQEGVSGEIAAQQQQIELLKAQLAVLQATVDELRQRLDSREAPSSASATAAVEIDTPDRALSERQSAAEKAIAALQKQVNDTVLSGKMFVDFSHIDQKNSDTGKTSASGNGVDVKRFYFGATHRFNETWSANVTSDFNFVSNDGETNLFIKKAYLRGDFSPAASLLVGSADLPWIPFVEGYYGYRYVEQTLTDRLKFGTSTDWGFHLGGKFAADQRANYAVSLVNGGGFRNPSRSQSVDVEARFGFSPVQNLMLAVGGYTGYLGKNTETVDVQHRAKRFDALAAYADSRFRFGAQYFHARNWTTVLSVLPDSADGFAFWASAQVDEKLNAFARYDTADVSRRIDDQADNEYYNFGLEYRLLPGIKLAAVYKHTTTDATANLPLPIHVQRLRTNEVGVFSEVTW